MFWIICFRAAHEPRLMRGGWYSLERKECQIVFCLLCVVAPGLQSSLDCIKAFLVNKALALGMKEILLGTFLMSRNELECKIYSENTIYVFFVAFRWR